LQQQWRACEPDPDITERMAAIGAQVRQSAERRQEVLAVDLDQLYADRHAGSLVFRPGDVGRDYVDFALNPQSRVPFGYEWIDAVLHGGVAPGEIATLAAGSGNGKTTVMANIAHNNAHVPILMVSIEMPLILIAARLFAMSQGEIFRTLEERLKAGSDNLEYRIGRELEASFPHLGLMGLGAPSVELLEKAVVSYEEQWGQAPRLVMIDYLDLMSPNSENVEAVKAKYVALRAFAKAHELGVLVAHQLKRDVLEHRNGQPLRLCDVRYAGETESDHLVCVYREVNDRAVMADPSRMATAWRTIHTQVLKTKSGFPAGELIGHELGWNPDTLRITDTTDGWSPPHGPTGAMQVLMQQEELFDDPGA
jgi:KaiC/GvpD/RAD55 family RecA-like ATPase